MSYQKLTSEHDDIDLLAAALVDLVQQEVPQIDAVVAARDRLAVAVKDHLSGEDSVLYSKLIRSSVKGTAAKARAFADEFKDLRADWGRYLIEWPADSIESDWQAFGEETVSILGRLQQRVRRETELLYPLALQEGAIRLRARSA